MVSQGKNFVKRLRDASMKALRRNEMDIREEKKEIKGLIKVNKELRKTIKNADQLLKTRFK